MGRVLRVPLRDDGLRGRAEAWVAAGSSEGVVPRPAATVMLVRDTDAGPEVYVQRRVATMAFAPSMVVFPGGRVDPGDHSLDVTTDGLADLAAHMGFGVAEAAPFAAAAVREVEEECGVRVDAGALRCRGRWVTPALEPRRYDTWFFATRMPAGQEAIGTTTETEAEGWGHPADILALAARGELRLMPPTIVSLEQLASFDTVEAFLADEPPLDLVEPTLVLTPRGYVLESRIP